jgi:hypothetical protein
MARAVSMRANAAAELPDLVDHLPVIIHHQDPSRGPLHNLKVRGLYPLCAPARSSQT